MKYIKWITAAMRRVFYILGEPRCPDCGIRPTDSRHNKYHRRLEEAEQIINAEEDL